MNITKLAHDGRGMRALTGMDYREFSNLVPTFEKALLELRAKEKGRKRKVGGGKLGRLRTPAEKLLFVLIYLKVYPTFDVLGVLTDRDRGNACRGVHNMLPALELALGKRLALPKRRINSVEEFFNRFPIARDVFVDGTERRVQKPKNQKRRNKLYSGKKKSTMRKNVIVADEKKKILVLTPTKSGRRHDKRLADKVALFEHIPKEVAVWVDTGFKGVDRLHPNVVMPARASKGKPLSMEQKEENRIISSFRVLSEHAIAGIKRLRSVSDIYRNKKANLDDTFMLLAAGLWNLHLQEQTA